MYTLFVSGDVADRVEGVFTVGADRFLEHTSGSLSVPLRSLSIETVDHIMSWPCILMQEGREEERAALAQVTGMERGGGGIRLTVVSTAVTPPIHNKILWALRDDLDIQEFEFHRHHLAVKDRDVISVLAANGHHFEPEVTARFSNKRFVMPTRAMLISAIDVISEWGHTEIDRFLLEAGVSGLSAGRELGGRKNRANAIVQFAINNPSATTAENWLFSIFLMGRASPQSDELRSTDFPQLHDQESLAAHSIRPAPVQQSSNLKPGPGPAKRDKEGLKLFYSYSHKDEGLREALEAHLSLLKRQGVIQEWHDRKISAGADWKGQIDSHLASADIVLLLVSADFIASDYCFDIEMQKALEQNNAGRSRVIPVILRSVDWTSAPFGKLQALPKDAKPITSWANPDEAFTSVAIGLRRVAAELRSPPHKLYVPLPAQREEPVGANQLSPDASSEYRFLVKEREQVPFHHRVIGRGNFIYDFSIEIPFIAIEGIKASVQVYKCSSDGSRRMIDEADALVTTQRPLRIPRTPWQLWLVEAKGATAVVELRKTEGDIGRL